MSISNRLSFSLGDGLSVKFWIDPWVESRFRLMDSSHRYLSYRYKGTSLWEGCGMVAVSLGCYSGSESLLLMNFLNLWICGSVFSITN